ncbi:hypothetical protein CEXT_782521 [Caerostris extrusa]|uniref:Secreted protein n=1 Tax=Caerostris extrusa TaxID=172846 RepID=A0AAV4MIJ0_CAEEX|nr:hypothetical protein CEXT_782521 [Caerostris extrusa]
MSLGILLTLLFGRLLRRSGFSNVTFQAHKAICCCCNQGVLIPNPCRLLLDIRICDWAPDGLAIRYATPYWFQTARH